jgi:hypothetical protein
LILQRLPRAVGTVLEKSHLPLPPVGSIFRYSNRVKLGVDDAERTDRAVRRIEGKRLSYRRTRGPRPEAGSETQPRSRPSLNCFPALCSKLT